MIEFCIHRDVSPRDPVGHIIDAWTRTVNQGPWILADGPATHAFLAVDGFRLDAAPPVTAWHMDHARDAQAYTTGNTKPEARWTIDLDPLQTARLLRAAGQEDGQPYDLGEIAQQAFTPVLSQMGVAAGFRRGRICTTTVTACMVESGHPVLLACVKAMKNHVPESLGRELESHKLTRTR